MKIESHLRNYKESLGELEQAIRIGLEGKQRTIGFHASVAMVDLLEMFLHKKNLLSSDQVLKHDWFASKNKIQEKLPMPFDRKEEILTHMRSIEEKRNTLCYGSPQEKQVLEEIIQHFQTLRKIFKELGLDEIK